MKDGVHYLSDSTGNSFIFLQLPPNLTIQKEYFVVKEVFEALKQLHVGDLLDKHECQHKRESKNI